MAQDIARLEAGLPGPAMSRLCHRDPLPANIVGRRAVRLIDWEYAGAGKPAFDIAAVCSALPTGAAARFAALACGPEGATAAYAGRHLVRRVGRLWTMAVAAAHRSCLDSQELGGYLSDPSSDSDTKL
jgi:Ser/Thr protein kinase RdoA (MazF antagonist)